MIGPYEMAAMAVIRDWMAIPLKHRDTLSSTVYAFDMIRRHLPRDAERDNDIFRAQDRLHDAVTDAYCYGR